MNKGKIALLKHFATREQIKQSSKDGEFFYIGRKNKEWKLGASIVANPFGISRDCSREQSTKSYKHWLFGKIKAVDSEILAMLRAIIFSDRPILVCGDADDANVVLGACAWLEKLFL